MTKRGAEDGKGERELSQYQCTVRPLVHVTPNKSTTVTLHTGHNLRGTIPSHRGDIVLPPSLWRIVGTRSVSIPPGWPRGHGVCSTAEEHPGYDSRFLLKDFSRVESYSDLQIGTPVATLPGAWRDPVIAGTGWPGVSIL